MNVDLFHGDSMSGEGSLMSGREGSYESEDEQEDIFMFDSVPTVAPRKLDTNAEYHSDLEDDSQDEPLAYAVLEFPDADYPIRERSIVLGRDRDYQRWLDGESQYVVDGLPVSRKRKRSSHEADASNQDGGTHGQADSRLDGMRRTLTAGIVGSHLADAAEEPFIPIHSSYDESTGAAPRIGSISKRHLRIYLDEDEGWFMEVLGRNGVMLNDTHRPGGSVVPLNHADVIQLADVQIHFRCEDPDDDVAMMEDSMLTDPFAGLDAAMAGGKSGGKGKLASALTDAQLLGQDIEMAVDEQQAAAGAEMSPTAKLSALSPTTPDATRPIRGSDRNDAIMRELAERGMIPTGKRGPGRPPKNGLLSHREFRELKKELEVMKREENPNAPSESKTGKVRKDSDVGAASQPGDAASAEKKIKKIKKFEGEGLSGGPERRVGPPEEPPEDPLPDMSTYTKEELEKPAGTYQTLLWQILHPLFPDGLTLQQIYDQFQRRWPHYRTLPSQGWQSSIRHTVRGDSFKQGEKSGKGYMHTINPENPPETKPKPASNPTPSHYPSGVAAHARPPQYIPQNGQMRGPTGHVPPHQGHQPQYMGSSYAQHMPPRQPPHHPNHPVNHPHHPSNPTTPGKPAGGPQNQSGGMLPRSPYAPAPGAHATSQNGGQFARQPYNSTASPAGQGSGIGAPPNAGASPLRRPGTGASVPPQQPSNGMRATDSPQRNSANTAIKGDLGYTAKEYLGAGIRPSLFDEFKNMMVQHTTSEEQRKESIECCELAFKFLLSVRGDPNAEAPKDIEAVPTFVHIIRNLLNGHHEKTLKRRQEAGVPNPPPPVAPATAASAQTAPQSNRPAPSVLANSSVSGPATSVSRPSLNGAATPVAPPANRPNPFAGNPTTAQPAPSTQAQVASASAVQRPIVSPISTPGSIANAIAAPPKQPNAEQQARGVTQTGSSSNGNAPTGSVQSASSSSSQSQLQSSDGIPRAAPATVPLAPPTSAKQEATAETPKSAQTEGTATATPQQPNTPVPPQS